MMNVNYSQDPDFDPTETAPVLFFRIEYRENFGEVMSTDLHPEDYNPTQFADVSFVLRVQPNTNYQISVAAFNIRGAGDVFRFPDIVTPCRSELMYYCTVNCICKKFSIIYRA